MKELARPENQRHYPGLDGLRGFAVLMVMFQHYIVTKPGFEWGWTGVRIFFALSGFLITGILYDTRTADRRWSVFYARRSLRIFPLYYGILLVAVLLYPLCHWRLHVSYWFWPFYLQNLTRFIWPSFPIGGVIDHLYATSGPHALWRLRYGHFWSLAVEEQFYLLWPLLVFYVRRRETLMKICAWVVVVTPLLRFACTLFLPERFFYLGFQERFTPLQFDSLLVGAFFALWMRGPHPDLTKLAYRTLTILFALLAVVEIGSHFHLHHALWPEVKYPVFGSLGLSCVNLASAAVVLLAIDSTTWLSRALRLKPLRYLGTISYGFYVFHDLLHDLWDRPILYFRLPNPSGATSAIIGFFGTLLVATLSFYAFERPFLRLKSRFTVPKREIAVP